MRFAFALPLCSLGWLAATTISRSACNSSEANWRLNPLFATLVLTRLQSPRSSWKVSLTHPNQTETNHLQEVRHGDYGYGRSWLCCCVLLAKELPSTCCGSSPWCRYWDVQTRIEYVSWGPESECFASHVHRDKPAQQHIVSQLWRLCLHLPWSRQLCGKMDVFLSSPILSGETPAIVRWYFFFLL